MEPTKKQGGKRPGSGRKPKVYTVGDEPKNTTVKIEPSVAKECRVKHGSLSNALRIAAKL